jgi:hypothetical protein
MASNGAIYPQKWWHHSGAMWSKVGVFVDSADLIYEMATTTLKGCHDPAI